MAADLEPIYVVVPDGRVHMGARIEGRVFTDERCNIDDAKDRLEIVPEVSDVDPERLCERCFPADEAVH